ncbi:MAG: FxsA family protein [Acidimicrobiia bacterium]
MIPLVGLLFLLAPFVELYVIVKVAGEIGVGSTFVALVAISFVGAWLAKRAGLGVLRRLQSTVAAGRVPSAEIVDGVLILFAGALMLAPGFVSDALAVLLLLPPTRAVLRRLVLRRIRQGGAVVTIIGGRPGAGGPGADRVRDARSWERPPRDRGELGP